MILKVIKNAFSYLKIWNHYTKTICKVIIRFKRVQKLSKFHHFRTIFELFLNLTFYPAQFYTISSKVVFFVNRKYDYYGDLWYRFINWIVIGSFRFDLYRRLVVESEFDSRILVSGERRQRESLRFQY